MLIGVATRKYARSVRLPDGDLAAQDRRATTRSSVSRRFVALSTTKLKEWLAADRSGLGLLVIQIDGLRIGDHVLVVAIGIDGAGDKHVLAVALGATESAAVVTQTDIYAARRLARQNLRVENPQSCRVCIDAGREITRK
jgi:putative transposase